MMQVFAKLLPSKEVATKTLALKKVATKTLALIGPGLVIVESITYPKSTALRKLLQIQIIQTNKPIFGTCLVSFVLLCKAILVRTIFFKLL